MKTLNTLRSSERTCKPFDPIEVMNKSEDEPDIFDCPICKNKGVIYYTKNGYELCRDCECQEKRRNIRRIERSGLKEALKKCTFESFTVENSFQEEIKNKAVSYIKDYQGKWFFIGGQVGCGKTHICTAIVRKLLVGEGKSTRYMQWREEVPKIKSKANTDECDEIIKPWKTVEVLYIDDLFKTEQGQKPTTADVNVAFEILNYRCQNPKLITIISSERSITEIVGIDEAVGSRIFQKSRDYCINIGRDVKKNYRLRGMKQ